MILVVDYFFLLISFAFTFIIPGFALVETFFSKIPKIQKIPLYFLLSVIITNFTVYIISLILGFSRISALFSFVLYIPWFFWVCRKKSLSNLLNCFIPEKKHIIGFVFALFVFVLFLSALYKALFFRYNDFFIMAADNWQDTAMHMSIVQSISQGNFPPKAPYFSGHPLSYYYFVDLHTAILQVAGGHFMPRIFVLDNSVFVFVFVLAVYALGYYLTKSVRAALFSSFLGVFNANFMYLRFFQDIRSFVGSGQFFHKVTDLLTNHVYAAEYPKLMQMTPVVNYFLQNRPMMIGLPAFTAVILLVLGGYHKNNRNRMLLAGLIGGAMFKFQFFVWVSAGIIFLLSLPIFMRRKNLLEIVIKTLYFLVPFVLLTLFSILLTYDRGTAIRTFITSLSFGPWDHSKNLYWYIAFAFANFGMAFAVLPVLALLTVFNKVKLTRKFAFIVFSFLGLLTIPVCIKFTIFEYDMLKFFHLMMIPMAVIVGSLLAKMWSIKLGPVIVFIFLAMSSLTAFLNLSSSYLNKSFAYSMEDFQVGNWIRKYTPQRSVFVSLDTVHSPITDIGGRLRILSYTTWPYSQGFSQGTDNIDTRYKDMKSIYSQTDEYELLNTLNKYDIRYVYYGPDERSRFPLAENTFNNTNLLNLVYNSGSINIYEVLEVN